MEGECPYLKRLILVLVTILIFTGITYASDRLPSQKASQTSLIRTVYTNKTSSELVTVNIIKWCQDGTFKSEISKMPKDQYTKFANEFRSCKTVEDGFRILQRHGVVPRDKSLDDLRIAMKDKLRLLQIPGKWHCEELMCLVYGKIEGPMLDLYVPATFYLISAYGGYADMVCLTGECLASGTNEFRTVIVGWVGMFTPPLKQWFTPYDVKFHGITLLISCSAW